MKNVCEFCCMVCYPTDGPPKIGPPADGHLSVAIIAIDGPPGPSMAAIDGLPDHLWGRIRVVPLATNSPP